MTKYPTIDMIATGKQIEALRFLKGWSIKELQDYFGFEYPQAIYKWQCGRCVPSVDNLYALAKLFGVRMDDIIAGADNTVIAVNRLMLNLMPRSEHRKCPLVSLLPCGDIRVC